MTTLEKMALAIGDIINEAGGVKGAKRKMAQRKSKQQRDEPRQELQSQEPQSQESQAEGQIGPHEVELDDHTKKIKKAKVHDILQFGIREVPIGAPRDNDDFISEGELIITVINHTTINNKPALECVYITDHSSGHRKSEYDSMLNEKKIYISLEVPLEIVGEQIQMNLIVENNKGKLSNYVVEDVYYIGVNKTTPNSDNDGKVDDTISREKYRDSILFNKDIAASQIHQQTPWATLAGASPTGLYYLNQAQKKHQLDNGYLKKGNVVTFKVISNTTYSDRMKGGVIAIGPHKEDGYEARVVSDKKWKWGPSDKRHWEFIILDQDEETKNYKIKVQFCTDYNSCKTKGEMVVQLLKNEDR